MCMTTLVKVSIRTDILILYVHLLRICMNLHHSPNIQFGQPGLNGVKIQPSKSLEN